MKKLFTLVSITVLSILFFSSCSSGWSFTKRKYTRGYYVSKEHKLQQPKEHSLAQKNSSTSTVKNNITSAVPKNQSLAAVQTNALPKRDLKSPTLEANAATATRKAEHRQQPVVNRMIPSVEIKRPIKTVETAIEQHRLSAGDSEGLSLFWIIILIILILWALGLISGNFGAIINVLLVVALILLILWLLRIL